MQDFEIMCAHKRNPGFIPVCAVSCTRTAAGTVVAGSDLNIATEETEAES
jgi:hypothetical protein